MNDRNKQSGSRPGDWDEIEPAPADGALAAPPGDDHRPHETANLTTSTRIAAFLTVSVFVVTAAVVGFTYWITREHNRLAATSSEQMIHGGIAALEDQLRTVQMDFAIWPDAVEAFARNDRAWIAENFGLSVTAAGTTDLMMVWHTDGTRPYGWIAGMDHTEPSTTLVPQDALTNMRGLLDAVDPREREPVVNLFAVEDAVWMLSSARLVQENPDADPALDADIPRLIFGTRLDDRTLGAIGRQYLIDDLSLDLSGAPHPAEIPLIDAAGETVGRAVWTPPMPGDTILRRIAVPLVVGLGLLVLVALVTSRLLSRSARRLESAMLSAQAASRAKTDFIANVSHELRTPMNGIIGLARLLRQSRLEHRQEQMVEMLLSSSETQMRLINDLLDISSIEDGRFVLNVTPFSPATVVEQVCGLSAIVADEKGLKLEHVIDDPDKIQVLGDRERFRQICANLVSNALKFTETGGVTVTLRLRGRLGNAAIQLDVVDTGPGIAPDVVDRIFDRFVQGSARDRGKAQGNGLGLAITNTIVQHMGGEIGVDSQVGEGAAFHVRIELERARNRTETTAA